MYANNNEWNDQIWKILNSCGKYNYITHNFFSLTSVKFVFLLGILKKKN